MELVLTRYNKYVFNKFNRKEKTDYILNIDKIVKSKIGGDINIMNKYQAFILNYEISRLLSKVINCDPSKYSRIVYVNQNISVTSVLSLMKFFSTTYKNVKFNVSVYYDQDDQDMVDTIDGYVKIKNKVVINKKSEI